MNLEVEFCGLTFKNPLVAASTDMSRSPESFTALLDSGVGAVVTKSVTDAAALQAKSIARFDIRDEWQRPVRGQAPRSYTFFSRGGSMVSMEQFSQYGEKQLQEAREKGVVLIGSIAASKKENWVDYAVAMEAMGFPMLELNMGNPHGEAADGKLGFLLGQSEALCSEIVGAVLERVRIPVIVKLTPQVTDMTAVVKALEAVGAKAINVMHRYQGLIVDPEEETVALGGYAAIGGPWMKPIALANIAKIHRQFKGMALCGGNGVDTGRDLVEYMLCGASLVQVGSTLMLRGAEAAAFILAEAQKLLEKKSVDGPGAIVGRAAEKIVTYKNLGQLPVRESSMEWEQCKECTEKPCVSRCYFGALSCEDGLLVKEQQLCTGCGMCYHVCGREAVTLVTRKEGEEK